MLKKILIALAIVLVLIQFVRPAKNSKGSNAHAIYVKHNMPPEVGSILKPACLNCHSNHTTYPWYAEVQPAAWWLANHVKNGKKNLNFSEFTNRSLAYQYHKFEEIAEMVEEKEMPLPSYTWFGLHPEANLTDAQRQKLIVWAKSQMAMMAAKYPADSLVMKK
jgi:hypothetical protein